MSEWSNDNSVSRTALLDLVRDDALGREYREAAASRPESAPPSRAAGRVAALLVIAAFGALVTLAAVQTERNADVADASRAQVLNRVESTGESLQAAQESLAELRRENAAAEDALVDLGGDLAAEQADATALEARTGFTAVVGPGIRVTFENLPTADQSTDWVRDSDLAALVNGLWAAGAEAVSVNGQRITGTGGIRNVGTHVEINGVTIASPYTVLAIGDPDTLSVDLLYSDGGAEFYELANQFGWRPESRVAPELRIPAASAGLQRLRSAQHLDDTGRGEAP